MIEKEYNNTFKFAIKQGDVLLCEKIFDADTYSPITRNSINIKDMLQSTIRGFQKLLSRKQYETNIDLGDVLIDMLGYNHMLIKSYKPYQRQGMEYNPQSLTIQIENRTIRGVECKFGLYINENPIVERTFYVDGFNPNVKQSIDIVYEVEDIVYKISERIKANDIKNIWDDYYLINEVGLTPAEVRELSFYKREEILKRLN